ncbi:MAG: sugar ABC transporter substrate-binding protein [Chloroflexota bacterium]|nr:sugar ABC transporter substrate-binding protein [Chloroflexota bacterium]
MHRFADLVRALVVAVLLGVAGLSPGDVIAQGQPQDLAGQVTFQTWGSAGELAAYEQVVEAFEVQYPNITVSLVHVPDQADHFAELRRGFASGTSSDVFLLNYRNVGPIAASGDLTPVGPRLRESAAIAEDDYFEPALDAFRYRDGELTCLPQNLSSLVVYYNHDLFEANRVTLPTAEWTWQQFLDAATALTKDLDADGVPDQYGLATEPSLIRAAPFVWQAGGELVDDIQQPTTLTLDTPEARAGLQYFLDLSVTNRVVPSRQANDEQAPVDRFVAGGAAMLLESRQAVPALREGAAFDWDVAPLPRGQTEAGMLHGAGFCMSARTIDQDAAWAFMEFAGGPNGQTILSQTGRIVPSLKSVASGPNFAGVPTGTGTPVAQGGGPANTAVFVDTIPTIRRVPTTSTWPEIENTLDVLLERAFYGEITLDQAVSLATELTAEPFQRSAEETPVELPGA